MPSTDDHNAPWIPPVDHAYGERHHVPPADPYNEDPYYPDPYAKF
jgi:hypothetical protein